MTTFSYKALGRDGRFENGTVSAGSKGEAAQALFEKGLTPVEIRFETDVTDPWYAKEISFGRKISFEKSAEFSSVLGNLLNAQIALADALRIAQNSLANSDLTGFLERARGEVLEGNRLSDILAKTDFGFDNSFTAFVRIGEEANQLGNTLIRIGDYYRARAISQQKRRSAMIYPAILVMVSLIVFLILMFFVIPSLAPLFDQSVGDVPRAIFVFVAARELLIDWWILVVILFLCAGGAGIAFFASPSGREFAQNTQRSLPVLGRALWENDLSEVSYGLSLYLNAGQSLDKALLELSKVFEGRPVANILYETASAVKKGKNAASSLEGISAKVPIFPEMFAAGEKSNRLPEMCEVLAVILGQSSQARLERLGAIATPMITLVFGGGVGLMVFAVMNLILSINDSFL